MSGFGFSGTLKVPLTPADLPTGTTLNKTVAGVNLTSGDNTVTHSLGALFKATDLSEIMYLSKSLEENYWNIIDNNSININISGTFNNCDINIEYEKL